MTVTEIKKGLIGFNYAGHFCFLAFLFM